MLYSSYERFTAHVCITPNDYRHTYSLLERNVRITIKRIAEELGVSHSTVSRVLNDKHSDLVSESTRERIVQAASRMGYRPSRIAQALQGKGTQLIGVLVPDGADYFFHDVVRNLRHTLAESGYELMVFASPAHSTAAMWHRVLQWDLDGVFLFDYLFYVDGLWEALTQHHGAIPPVVGLFSNQSKLDNYVSVDFAPAMNRLLTHLVSQGCRKLGYVSLASSFQPVEQRYAVCSTFAAIHSLGFAEIPVAEAEASLMEGARVGLAAWLRNNTNRPDAIFCQNDEIALGAYRALREAGLSVPDDMLLAGCDDLPYVSYIEPPLTSLSLPVREACRQGWRLLQSRMDSPEGPPLRVTLEANLNLRESCIRSANRSTVVS
jgi:DNA-binding LacI/PurR family transcriptional regulator